MTNNDDNEQDDNSTGASAAADGAGDRQMNKRKQRGQSAQQQNDGSLTFDRVASRFAACGRCSYFFADCRTHFGGDAVRAAVDNSDGEWLELAWSEEFRQLTHNAYITDANVYYAYYDGCCPECCRRFTYADGSEEDQPAMFRIHI